MSQAPGPPPVQQQPPSISSSRERLQKLEKIEIELASAMQSAGQAMQELGKDKPSVKQVENHATSFLKGLGQVESDLSSQIHYLTQVSSGQAHEGSTYASQKILAMAWHRIEHAKSRLLELDRMNALYTSQDLPPTVSSGSVTSSVLHQNLPAQQQSLHQQQQGIQSQQPSHPHHQVPGNVQQHSAPQ